MQKVIARYFYTPNCTESFATLDRLIRLFKNIEDKVQFELYNTTEISLDSDYPWFSSEIKILETLKGKGFKPLIYNKLFIEGKEISGFPPSKTMIEKVLQEYDIHFPQEAYQVYYKNTTREKWNIIQDKISFKQYDKESLKDVCLVCTKHNPYLEEKDYMKENWCEYENAKEKYLEKKLQEEKIIAFIAYYEDQPVGLIEAYPLKLAAKLGFPVSDINLNGVMITCLNIRKEVLGNGIASNLVKIINEEARNRNYQYIEVLAFPDKYNWQPISLYQKYGYTFVREIEDLSLLRKILINN